MQETDLGIKFATMNTTPEVEREIDGSITFRFLDDMIDPFGAIFEVLYKGEKVSVGSLDFRGNPRPTLMRVLQRKGVLIVANSKAKRKLEDNGYDLGIEFDEEGRLF
jgi:branched-subunit amino acid aminotransferase/4-amino-4-deoxychorismate lyase